MIDGVSKYYETLGGYAELKLCGSDVYVNLSEHPDDMIAGTANFEDATQINRDEFHKYFNEIKSDIKFSPGFWTSKTIYAFFVFDTEFGEENNRKIATEIRDLAVALEEVEELGSVIDTDVETELEIAAHERNGFYPYRRIG